MIFVIEKEISTGYQGDSVSTLVGYVNTREDAERYLSQFGEVRVNHFRPSDFKGLELTSGCASAVLYIATRIEEIK